VADSGVPPSDNGGNQDPLGITRSEHARLRSGQGRPIGEVVNDVQRAGRGDVFVQPDDGRYVVRGLSGREHVIEANAEHVTSVRRPDAAHQARLRDGTIRPATEEEFEKLKAFVQ
jgi:hypothetical protein